jgi:hypothetical protein
VGVRARVVLDVSPGPAVRRPGDGAFDMTSAPTAPTTRSPAASGADRPPPVQLRLKASRRPPRVGSRADGGPARGTWWPSSRAAGGVGGLPRPHRAGELPGRRLAPAANKTSSSVAASSDSRGLLTTGRTMDGLAVRRRVTLLVVASLTSSQAARDALMAAARRDNADGVDVLRADRRAQPSRRGRVDGAEETAVQRWEIGGGGIHGG